MSVHRLWSGALRPWAICLLGAALASAALAGLPASTAAHPPLHGQVPAQSDVIFSTRQIRPESVETARAFGATRIEWVATQQPDFVAELRKAAPWFGGTLNSVVKLSDQAGYARGFDGELLTAPWMKAWGDRWWVTTTHPATQQAMHDQLARFIALGADSIQLDDPRRQVFAAERLGGDFNPATLAGFPGWLKTAADPQRVAAAGLTGFTGSYRDFLRDRHGVRDSADYRKRFRSLPSTPLWLDYLRATVVDHFGTLRQQAAAAAGRPVPLSMNLGDELLPLESSAFYFLAPAADYALAETRTADWPRMVSQAATLRALGLGWAPSLMPRELADNRVAIASLYALGGTAVVPWDTYAGNDDKGMPRRYYGTPQEYGDLYRFVRSHAALLDGFESAAVVGIVVPVDRAEEKPLLALVRRLAGQGIPFVYVPVGGQARHVADPARLRHLKLLVSTHADGDLPAGVVAALDKAGVPRLTAATLKGADLAPLRPFVLAPGAEALRLLPRADPARPGVLMLHVVDTRRGAPGADDETCRTRLGIRRDALGAAGVAAAIWHRLGDSAKVEAEATPDSPHVFFTLTGCSLWGVLELGLRPH
jgi:hypothetical protein